MNLALKFNLIFLGVFAIGLAAASYVAHSLLEANALQVVTDQASLMMEAARATRTYTTDHVKKIVDDHAKASTTLLAELKDKFALPAPAAPSLPSLAGITDETQKQAIMAEYKAAVDKQAEANRVAHEAVIAELTTKMNGPFIPETVPAFGATTNFESLRNARKEYADYTYKEATLNPTNPRNRATEWEADIVKRFSNEPALDNIVGTRLAESIGQTLYLARPLRVTKESCLVCHSTPENAPPSMIKLYGSVNGFNWHLNDVIGAQIVTVPMSVPFNLADKAFKTLVLSLVGVFLAVAIILNVLLYITIISPVRRLSSMANQVSTGNMETPELPVKGGDEIATLTDSFNRMYRSLAKAMRMIGE